MLVWKAAIAGPSAEVLSAGLEAFASRDDVERVVEHGSEATIAGRFETDAEGRTALVLLRVDQAHGVALAKELARSIATSAKTAVRVCFSGTEESGGAITPDYAAFHVEPSGATQGIQVEEADRFLREHPTVPADAKEEMWELLWSSLGELAPGSLSIASNAGFAFRARPLAEDPRIAELLTAARGAKSVELTKQADGRTLLRMTLADGSRRLSFLTAKEAELFERLYRK
jgi:hypothetical protein